MNFAGLDISGMEKRPSPRKEHVTMFKCTICPYQTPHKSSVRTHMKKHSAERPWQCDICQKTFKLKHHLKHHRITHRTSGPNFKCSLCPYRGTSTISLLLHKQLKHGETVPQINMNRTLNPSKKYSGPTIPSVSPTQWAPPSSVARTFSIPLPPMNFLASEMNFSRSDLGTTNARIRSMSDSEELPSITGVSSSSGIDLARNLDFPANLNFSLPITQPTVPTSTDAALNTSDETILVKEEMEEAEFSGTNAVQVIADSPEPGECSSSSRVKTPTEIGVHDSLISSPESSSVMVSSSNSSDLHTDVVKISDGSKPDILTNHGHVTTGTATSRDTWTCEPCGIIFPDNIMFGLHTACHSVLEPYKCNICGKVCRDKYDFTFHITMGKH